MLDSVPLDPENVYQFLKQRPRLNAWRDSELRALVTDIGDGMRYQAGDHIFHAERESDDTYLVYSGLVRQSVKTKEGVEWWHRMLTKNDFFTQQALFRGASYASSAVAQEESILLRISAAVLSNLLTKHPDLWAIFYNNTASRLQAIPLLRILSDEQIERLAVSAQEVSYQPEDKICSADQEEGRLYIVDWGQVRIDEQRQLEVSSGQRMAVPPTSEVRQAQGFPTNPALVTAGNYFVGGFVNIPQQMSVTAVAHTATRLIEISGVHLEQLEASMPDLHYLLRSRLAIATRLKDALAPNPLFHDLHDEHWHALATVAGWEHIPANLDVTRQGQVGFKLYVLAAGAAVVRATDDQRRERPRHVSRVGFMDTYGEEALLHGDHHSATTRSLADVGPTSAPLDGSDWLTLQHDDVLYLLRSDPGMWQHTKLWYEINIKPRETHRYSWQDDDEIILSFKHRHILWLLARVAAVFAGVVGIFALLTAVDGASVSIAIPSVTYVLISLVLLVPLLSWYLVDYLNDYFIITNKRVLSQERVFLLYENQETAPFERIQDINSRISFFGKLFNYSLIDITTAGLGSIKFEMMPDPQEIEEIVRRQQGLMRIESVAGDRDNLRNKILSTLKLRLIPTIPERVLPPGFALQHAPTGLQRIWLQVTSPLRRFGRWLVSRPTAVLLALVGLISPRQRDAMIQRRKQKAMQPSKSSISKSNRDIVYRKHPWFLLKTIVLPLSVLIGFAAIVAFTRVSIQSLSRFDNGLAIVSGVVLLICMVWLWYRIENWRNDTYILTKTHISYVYKLPLGLSERRRQAEWEKVQNANYEIPGLWANLINYGNVVVETASVEGKFNFENVPAPRKVQKEIMNRISLTRTAQSQRARDQQLANLSETLEIYSEVMKEWGEHREQMEKATKTF